MIAILDTRTPQNIRLSLEKHGYELLFIPKNPRLDEPVSAHPDMRLFILGKKVFISQEEKDELSSVTERLSREGYEIIPCSVSLSKKYPNDIAFNCVRVGNCLFGNLKHIVPEILQAAKDEGLSLISVKQGYTKCSTVIVSDNAVITADCSIGKACIQNGIDVLLISSADGDILLHGYSRGFIGGASGTCGDKIYFCGDLDSHPDEKSIREFCKKHKKTAVSLGERRLVDIGSILFV